MNTVLGNAVLLFAAIFEIRGIVLDGCLVVFGFILIWFFCEMRRLKRESHIRLRSKLHVLAIFLSRQVLLFQNAPMVARDELYHRILDVTRNFRLHRKKLLKDLDPETVKLIKDCLLRIIKASVDISDDQFPNNELIVSSAKLWKLLRRAEDKMHDHEVNFALFIAKARMNSQASEKNHADY
jgi:hypothetical protein